MLRILFALLILTVPALAETKEEAAIRRKNLQTYSNEIAGKQEAEQKALKEKNKALEDAWLKAEKERVK